MSIAIGSQLPEFSLQDQYEAVFSSSSIEKQACVLYFYPKNFTPNCTKEACSFRDNFQDFTDANVLVIGISSDTPASHKKFAAMHKLPFTLLSDSKKQVRKLFKIKNSLLGVIPGRETFVFDSNKILISKFRALNAQPHIDNALHMLKQLS